MKEARLCDYCKYDEKCSIENKFGKSCAGFNKGSIKEARAVDIPPMWGDVKRDLPGIIQKILDDDCQVKSIDIHFTASTNEIPELTYTIERYAWEREERNGRT